MLWLIAGDDPTGGAGIGRDLRTAACVRPELPVRAVVTAHTDQGSGRPASFRAVEEAELVTVLTQLEAPDAVKVGLVPDALVGAVVDVLERVHAPVVVDPVMVASDGGWLGATPRGLERLLRRADLVTPNRIEAEALLHGVDVGNDQGHDTDALLEALKRRYSAAAVLLKGGHAATGGRVVDHLVVADARRMFDRPRHPGPDPRGTGCALSTAIAAHLACGRSLELAVGEAIAWLDEARTQAVRRPDGSVHLP